MIALGLNAQGTDIALELNPGPVSPFDPATPPRQVHAAGVGVVRTDASGVAVAMLTADGSGIVRVMTDGAAVTNQAADGAGIVRTDAEGAES